MNKWEYRVGMIGPLGQRMAQVDEYQKIIDWMRSMDPNWDPNDDESYFNPTGLEGPSEIVVNPDGSWEASNESRVDEFESGIGLAALQALFTSVH